MNTKQRVQPSQLVDSFLPNFISENYRVFVEFMTSAFEAEERLGFSRDILQNLDKYRDFDTYKAKIVKQETLFEEIGREDDELTLVSGQGFPERDGVILIDEEVILYRYRDGNTLVGLVRGAPGTTKLPSYIKPGEYLENIARPHTEGAKVVNLSVLVLSSFLDTIHKTFADNIISDNVNEQINRGTLLTRIKDFFQSKGTKLGIQSLFKILFADNDVDVTYPGDLMLKASDSTFDERLVIRSVPVSPLLSGIDVLERYELPDSVVGLDMRLKSFNDEEIYARVSCEYVTSYPIESEVQYDISVDKTKVVGEVLVNPSTNLTRALEIPGTVTDNNRDVFTVTVQSTVGFPDKGHIIINDEAIYYSSKSINQFLNCRRGAIGVPALHDIGEVVYGPYYLESVREEDNLTYKTRSFPTGLVKSVNVVDGGLFYKEDDPLHYDKPGQEDLREIALTSFIENINFDLVKQYSAVEMQYVANYTAGVSAVYFDEKNIFISSTNLPYYEIGPFSDDNSVGSTISADQIVHVIPRRDQITQLEHTVKKGTTRLGLFVDGVSAISCNSHKKVYQGKIARFEVISGGTGYVNPTVILEPNNSEAKAIVDKGRIVGIESTTVGGYDYNPAVIIDSGSGAELRLNFDPFGRVTSVDVLEGGRNYNDIPRIELVDSSDKGKGGRLAAEVLNGEIVSVTVQNSGIDYGRNTTSVNIIPQGYGAEVGAFVESYTFDRFKEVLDNPNWQYDRGLGFLYENANGTRNIFGYVASPAELRRSLNDVGLKHSPIVGWAYDGNPIYGPFGWTNGKDNTAGIERQKSGFGLVDTRMRSIPDGGDMNTVPFDPPSETEYPLGTFVNDYVYLSRVVTVDKGLYSDVTVGDSEQITTQIDQDIMAQTRVTTTSGFATSTNVLDPYNGKVCNTPEYPKELYPDGVYCYFLTVNSSGIPQFPYIIGESFKDAPMSQRIELNENNTQGLLFSSQEVFEPDSFDETALDLDFSEVERHRHPYLLTSAQELELRISDVDAGNVSQFHYTSLKGAKNKMVGDLTYISEVKLSGSGALGRVAELTGRKVISAENDWIQSRIVSHHQRIDLGLSTETYVFTKGSKLRTSSGAVSIVRNYDPQSKLLDVQTITPNLIQEGDVFLDNRNVTIFLQPPLPFSILNYTGIPQFVITTEDGQPIDDQEVTYSEIVVEDQTTSAITRSEGNSQIITGYYVPISRPDGSNLKEGDLWWCTENGKLYVLNFDHAGNFAWVVTQPLAMTPLIGASDRNWGSLNVSGNAVYAETDNYTLTISEKAPGMRGDGNPLVVGDLWWSPHTGGLYIYHSDVITYYLDEFVRTGEIPTNAPPVGYSTSAEWVCTDPLGVVPQGDYASDEIFPSDPTKPFGHRVSPLSGTRADGVFVQDLTVLISENPPLQKPDASPVDAGVLWWCPVNGKMYIYYNSPNGDVWVVTNPSSSLGGQYSIDGIPSEGGNIIIPPGGEIPSFPGGLDILPELESQDVLWVLDYTDFITGDRYEIVTDSTGNNNEIVILGEKRLYDPTNSEIKVIRGASDDTTRSVVHQIPTSTVIRNLDSSKYEIVTEEDHALEIGDVVYVSGSSIDAVNGKQIVNEVGTVRRAILRARVNPVGNVSQVFIDYPGYGYKSDFVVTVVGDGVGAILVAEVNTFEQGGSGEVINVRIDSGGINYTFADLIANPPSGQHARDYFSFTVDGIRGTERTPGTVTYTTESVHEVSDVVRIDVASAGSGYLELPPIDGLIMKEVDRAFGIPLRSGTSISGVDITRIGARYDNPTPVFTDLAGLGRGAKGVCEVIGGQITGVTMTSGGVGYIEPVVAFVEMDDMVYADSDNIGIIKGVQVISPGRNIPSDLSIRPEIDIETRLLVEPYLNTGLFERGDEVYQGMFVNPQAKAKVADYSAANNTMLLDDIDGVFKKGDPIYSISGHQGLVVNVRQARMNIDVSGAALQSGRFIDEKGFVSSFYSVLQDSLYYQNFSYVISSQVESDRYVNFVNSIVHPSGFVMFSDIEINQMVSTIINIEDIEVDTDVLIVEVAGADAGDDELVIGADHDGLGNQVIGWDDK